MKNYQKISNFPFFPILLFTLACPLIEQEKYTLTHQKK